MENAYSITSLNESAILVSFGNVIEEPVNQKVIDLHRLLRYNPFPGFVESVPAYSSLAIFYDVAEVFKNDQGRKSSFDFVKEYLETFLNDSRPAAFTVDNRMLKIPVLYNGEDLELVASENKLTVDEVIRIHTSKDYRVFMIGFLPGFPYMGTVDEKIATARKKSPRTSVPAGSIGIAGYQTGIYPQSSPGGWQLIGQTPFRLFRNEKPSPCLFDPGDLVRFYPIDKNEFDKLNEY